MGSLTAKQAISLVKTGSPCKTADGRGLYLVVPKYGDAFWALRYTHLGRRRQMTLGNTSDLSLADARTEAELKKQQLRTGVDPITSRAQAQRNATKIVDHLFSDWFTNDIQPRLKHPHIPKRLYEKDISPLIGRMRIQDVTPLDIRAIVRKVVDSDRPTVANDVLGYAKQIFRHGIKLGLINENPAAAFTVSDAGGIEASRRRYLDLNEIEHVFNVFRNHWRSFGRDNYLACALFLTLGVRKAELCEAPWPEFDLNEALWHLPPSRSKTGAGITIPIPTQAVEWLKELESRSFGYTHVFAPRRASKYLHMGPDTLNRAITKLFGHESGKRKQPPNVMGDTAHFTVHDLRRTFRSLLSQQSVSPHIAERCLNHKLNGIEAIYDQYDYLEERKRAHQAVADLIAPYINVPFPT